jgi:hypothetical protein
MSADNGRDKGWMACVMAMLLADYRHNVKGFTMGGPEGP